MYYGCYLIMPLEVISLRKVAASRCYVLDCFYSLPTFFTSVIGHFWILDNVFQVVPNNHNLVLDGHHKPLSFREDLSLSQPRVRGSLVDIIVCQVMNMSSMERFTSPLHHLATQTPDGLVTLHLFICQIEGCKVKTFSCKTDVLHLS